MSASSASVVCAPVHVAEGRLPLLQGLPLWLWKTLQINQLDVDFATLSRFVLHATLNFYLGNAWQAVLYIGSTSPLIKYYVCGMNKTLVTPGLRMHFSCHLTKNNQKNHLNEPVEDMMVSLSVGDVTRQVWRIRGTQKKAICQTLSRREGSESIKCVSSPSKLKGGNHRSLSIISFKNLR
nr:uncharacterized protein LOC120966015 [Aegilops tauschii subsp. strangulata]